MPSQKDRYEASRWLSNRFASGKWCGSGMTVATGDIAELEVYQPGPVELEVYQPGSVQLQVYTAGMVEGQVGA